MSYIPERPGTVKQFSGTTPPIGWLFLCEKTIGSAASGATLLAAVNTRALFEILWNNFANTELPIQDSTGAPSVRGGSAGADFVANKRMPLPDARGRAIVGLDNEGGATAGRITSGGSGIVGTTLGTSGGQETHALTGTEGVPHDHNDAHSHNLNFGLGSDVANFYINMPSNTQQGIITTTRAAISFANAASRADSFTGSATSRTVDQSVSVTGPVIDTGTGTAHQNTQPTLILTHIVKL